MFHYIKESFSFINSYSTTKMENLQNHDLKSLIDKKYKLAAKTILEKKKEELKNTEPWKDMGAQPGNCTERNTFTLPEYLKENLSAQKSEELPNTIQE